MNLKQLPVLAAAALSAGSFAQQVNSLQLHEGSPVDQINSASLQSMESSWLAIPRACKAKEFNAEPREVKVEMPSAQIAALYSGL